MEGPACGHGRTGVNAAELSVLGRAVAEETEVNTGVVGVDEDGECQS